MKFRRRHRRRRGRRHRRRRRSRRRRRRRRRSPPPPSPPPPWPSAEADSLIAKCGGTGSGANCGLKGSKGTEVWEKSALAWILAVGMTAGTSGPDAMLPIVTLMYLGGAFSC